MQPPPPPDPNDLQKDADRELAEVAGKGCLAGMGVVGITALSVLGVLAAMVLVGGFLVFLTCGGH